MFRENTISIMDQILMRAVLAHNFSELLQRSVRARVGSHVYMAQSAGPVFDNHEYVEHSERGGDSH